MHMTSTLRTDAVSPSVIGGLVSGAAQNRSAERRRTARYPFTGTLEAIELDSETRIQGRTADLSEGGCCMDTMSPFPARTLVRVRITKEKRSFEAQLGSFIPC